MKHFIYFCYFIKITNWKKLRSHKAFIAEKEGLSKSFLTKDMVNCSLKYGLSFHEYYYYALFNKPEDIRASYASMGFMHEYQLVMNPKSTRDRFLNKFKFDESFPEYLGRAIINPLTATEDELSAFIQGKEKVVMKLSTGAAGKTIHVVSLNGQNAQTLKSFAKNEGLDLMEEFVYQHEDMAKLAPKSLNTVRVITQLKNDGTVDIIGSSIRMSIDKNTDNLSTGGITAKVNVDDGTIATDGVSFDITKPDYIVHPVSGVKIKGFQIPYWPEILVMVKNAAAKYDDNKSIGWDVAIKPEGPILIEGNHDWGARVWQMPAGEGMKYKLEKYL